MATPHVVTGDQYRGIDRRMREIKRQLDQQNGSPLDPDLVASALQQIVEGKFDNFAAIPSGLFVPPYQQLNCVKSRNIIRKWGFGKEHFEKLGEPPAWPSDRLSAVVLDVGLDTVEQTFEEAWHCIVESQEGNNCRHGRWDGVKSDREYLRLHGGKSHERGLKWRVIDFAAHWDKNCGVRPQDVRGKDSPDSACLWAASYFPNYIQAMDGKNIPYMWIPGYDLYVDRSLPWVGVPYLNWIRVTRLVELSVGLAGSYYPCWAVPCFREC